MEIWLLPLRLGKYCIRNLFIVRNVILTNDDFRKHQIMHFRQLQREGPFSLSSWESILPLWLLDNCNNEICWNYFYSDYINAFTHRTLQALYRLHRRVICYLVSTNLTICLNRQNYNHSAFCFMVLCNYFIISRYVSNKNVQWRLNIYVLCKVA